MISSGTSPLVRWTCSACGATTLLANARNVSCTISMSSLEVSRTGLVGEGTEEVGVAVRDDEVVSRRQRRRIDAPQLLATDQLADEVVHDVGDEGARDPGLDVALGAVVEQRLGGGDGRRRVGQVVGEHLVHVGTAGGRQLADRGADRLVGELDDVRGGGEVGRGDGDGVMPANVTDRGDRATAPSGGVRTWADGCVMRGVRGVRVLRFQRRRIGVVRDGSTRPRCRARGARSSARLRRRPRRADGRSWPTPRSTRAARSSA